MATSLTPSTSSRAACLHCGTHVTERYGRVYGDQDDRVHRCPDCDSHRRLTLGSAAGKDIDVPDPQENPGRTGGVSP